MYDELRHAGFSGCSEEDQEETFNRFLKPSAPPDSGNGVVVPHEAPDGPPKPKKKGKKNEPNSTCVLAITAPWSARVYAVARETHGRVCPLCYLLPVVLCWNGVTSLGHYPSLPLSSLVLVGVW